jgi:hypothetical protein
MWVGGPTSGSKFSDVTGSAGSLEDESLAKSLVTVFEVEGLPVGLESKVSVCDRLRAEWQCEPLRCVRPKRTSLDVSCRCSRSGSSEDASAAGLERGHRRCSPYLMVYLQNFRINDAIIHV